MLLVLLLSVVPLQASGTVDEAASARCDQWLSEREAIVAEVGRASREGQRFAELGRQIHVHCLNGAVAPVVRARALLAEATSTESVRAQSEKRLLLEEARGLLKIEAPRSREMILVLEQLATLSEEFTLSESEALLERSLQVRGELFGAESRMAVVGRHLLVSFFRFRGSTAAEERADLATARSEAERFVQESTTLFGEGDPVTVVAWTDLAEVARELEGDAAAERILETHVYPYPGALTGGLRLAMLLD